ncbi:Integral membrane protein [Fusarium acuminatum]|uniref:Integral membrane protein n=1 Tax=Fusarium acuminatum TaxID=5515 RepID=A0ABZ2X1X5_9HYPO
MAPATETRGPELMAVMISFFIMSLISCLLRFYVRCFMIKAFKIDDWFMVLAMIFYTLYASFSIYGVTQGTGQHMENLNLEQIHMAMLCWWLGYIWYCLTMLACKLSIGLFLLHIATSKLHKWTIYVTMFCSTVSGILFFFISVFQCRPISFAWYKDQPGKCIHLNVTITLTITYSITAVISDFVFALLPGFIVWKLQLKKRVKYSLIPLLAMGCIASAAVVARFPYLAGYRKPDWLWHTVDVAIWSAIEQGLAITATSLATLRPLFKLAGFHLGFASQPTSFGASGHKSSSRTTASGNHGGLSGQFSGREVHALPSISRLDAADRTKKVNNSRFLNESEVGIRREIKWEVNLSTHFRSESEEDLRSPDAWSSKPGSHWV